MPDCPPSRRCRGTPWVRAGVAWFLLIWMLRVVAAGERHWAFEPVTRVQPPEVREAGGSENPIDRFILAGLAARGLARAPAAAREVFLRRVTFDLTGLPPTPAEVEGFLGDGATGAEGRVVERLLASPRYGERWGRHWLDLARYAESDGFEHDAIRPHAWRYRDYVIRAFNEDKPYDRFVREQIAGDELWQVHPDAIMATAFGLLGPDMVDSADPVQRRLNTLNDLTDTTASVFLGLTLGCARCHAHKFEPLSQRDYFSWQAFYAGAEFAREFPVPTPEERAAHESAMVRYRAESTATQDRLDALEGPYRERLREGRLATLSEDARLAHRTPKEQRTPEQEGTVGETAPTLKVGEGELAASMSAEDRARRERLLRELRGMAKPAGLPATMALQNRGGPPPRTFVLTRGDYSQPGEEVSPGFPAVLRCGGETPRPEEAKRSVLADWIASPANPLTARVMVNRLWQHHFGRGLVETPSDFGVRGARPTHPQLLDWLAGEFVTRGWSVKAMHRLILGSATYRQASEPTAEALARDPENRLFSRQNRVRLEGEAVRDALLAISGRLDALAGGPGVGSAVAKEGVAGGAARRSVYLLARRNLRVPFLEVFDAPDSNVSCPERGRSTTAPQALTLLNSAEVMAAAAGLAGRLMAEAASDEARLERAFRLTLGRGPTGRERSMAREFLEATRRGAVDAVGGAGADLAAWRELGRALFNLNAFIHVD